MFDRGFCKRADRRVYECMVNPYYLQEQQVLLWNQ